MSEKKSKLKRKETGFHPADKRKLRRVRHSNNKTTVFNLGERQIYQQLKKEK